MTNQRIVAALKGGSASLVLGFALVAAPSFAQTTDSATPQDQAPVGSAAPTVQGAANASADASVAQDQTAPGGADIIVTGSRIPQPNLTSASPITVLNSQEAKLQGTTRIEDLVNSLPQAFAAQSGAVSNGSSGTATVNLRNLGDQRTLVLVNGRRLMPGDPNSPTPDLNFIPTSLIKRVDVLTGGASSVYGSDAVAGVVNFILDTDFTGFGLDSEYGVYQHDNRSKYFQGVNQAAGYSAPDGNSVNGRTFDATFKVGAGFDDNRGHVVGYFGYRKLAKVTQDTRDYSNCGYAQVGDEYACSGSATAFPATISIAKDTLGGGKRYAVGANGTLTAGSNIFNANPYNYYQRPDKRYTAGFFGHYDIDPAFKPYMEFGFMDDRTNAVIAPSGDFGNTTTINCNNPFLSAQEQTIICQPANLVMDGGAPAVFLNPDGTTYNQANLTISRRNVEGGGRDADFRHTDYRAVVGAKGDIAKGLTYDAYFQFGATEYNLIYRNEFSVSRLNNAIDVINDADGQPACRAAITGADPNCVPVNFLSNGSLNADQLNYLQIPGFQNGENKEKVASASLTFLGGEYGIQSPWSDDGIGINIGGEYRKETLRLEVDNEFATGDLAGQGGPTLPLSGSFDVKEAFAEVSVPIVSDKPFFHQLTLDGGYRYSDYSTSGGVSSYKGQLTWAPVRDITFRGGYNRAVRAANVQELFLAQSVQIDGSIDPCAGAIGSATLTATQAQCVNLGVAAADYGSIPDNPSKQYNGLVGGNPNLKPEKADTYTVGVILQPTFLPGFSATVDAFQIKVKNLIGTVGADAIVNQCVATGDPTFCSLIHRDQFGSLYQTPNAYVQDTNLNAGFLKTRGIDVNADYTLRTDNMGSFNFNIVGTYLDEFERSVVPADYDCAGYYGGTCGTPAPKWRHKLRVGWNLPGGFGISAQWRFFGKTKYDAISPDSDLNPTGTTAADVGRDAHIKAQSFFDLALTGHIAEHYDLRLGVNNILDKRPPILSNAAAPIGSFGNGSTYPTVYDALGRFLFVGISLNY